jgi:hypothetical protein
MLALFFALIAKAPMFFELNVCPTKVVVNRYSPFSDNPQWQLYRDHAIST